MTSTSRCDDASVSEPPASEPPASEPPGATEPAVFRLPRVSLVAVLLLVIGATPVAAMVPGLESIYLISALLLVWVLRTRTTVGPDGVAVRRIRTRRLPWAQLEGLALRRDGRVRAVLHGGRETALPGVRTRHLPLLAQSSGGRITDPTQS